MNDDKIDAGGAPHSGTRSAANTQSLGVRGALETARQEIVLAIAFLGRDAGSDRLQGTITSLIARLAKADAAIIAALASPEPSVTGGHIAVPCENCDFFDMLWNWFEERRGSEDMRANHDGLSADDFKNMLDEHEASLLPDDAATPPQDAPAVEAASSDVQIELVAVALFKQWYGPTGKFDDASEKTRQSYRNDARVAIAATTQPGTARDSGNCVDEAAQGYADSLRQQADWIEAARDGKMDSNDIDVEEIRATAGWIESRFKFNAQHQTPARPPSQPGREEIAPVKRIEMVDFSSGFKMPADPEWRIEIGGYCADFPTETAANNFRAAILSLTKGAEPGALDRRIADLRSANAVFATKWQAEAETHLGLAATPELGVTGGRMETMVYTEDDWSDHDKALAAWFNNLTAKPTDKDWDELMEILATPPQEVPAGVGITDEMVTAFQRSQECSFGGYSREDIAAGLRAALTQPGTALDSATIDQHIGWLKQFITGMDDGNWRDMQLRAERQLQSMTDSLRSINGGEAHG